MKIKKRLDVLLTEQGYADTRSKAQAIIMSGQVYVNGQKADKPGISYEETAQLEVRGDVCPYVSRGGLKLEKALRDFGVKPEGYVCSDSGASTGGFTDCLLQQGAKKVFHNALILLTVIGLFTTALMFFGSDFLARITNCPGSETKSTLSNPLSNKVSIIPS